MTPEWTNVAETPPPRDIDAYIALYPPPVQAVLRELRATIRSAAPRAEEAIKYGMPTFVQDGNLVHFGVHKTHIGLYPVPRAVAGFREEIAAYGGEKSTMHLPLEGPVPVDLIRRIVRHQATRNRERADEKRR